MSESITLATLRTQTRQHADMENSLFVTDSELNDKIDKSYADFYDFLVKAGSDYFATSASLTIASGNTMSLPSNFLSLRGLDDITDSSNPLTVRKYNFAERNTMDEFSTLRTNDTFSPVYYRIYGDLIDIRPISLAPRPYKLYYIPRRTPLAADGDSVDSVNGWAEYIAIHAAIKCLAKEESSTTALEKQLAELKERIMMATNDRDSAQPERIARVRNRRRSLGLGPGFTDGP